MLDAGGLSIQLQLKKKQVLSRNVAEASVCYYSLPGLEISVSKMSIVFIIVLRAKVVWEGKMSSLVGTHMVQKSIRQEAFVLGSQ